MTAGLLIIVPASVVFGGDLVDWHPHKLVVLGLGFVCIAGIIWLYDEVREIRAEQKLASVASENPFRTWNPEAFDKGAKINQQAEELRRVAAKELTGSGVVVAPHSNLRMLHFDPLSIELKCRRDFRGLRKIGAPETHSRTSCKQPASHPVTTDRRPEWLSGMQDPSMISCAGNQQ
jgi:hypothetical protein